MTLRERWEANFLFWELALGTLLTIGLAAWSELFGGADEVGCFLHEHGETLYMVLAPIDAAMLGFILAAAAIVVTAAPADRMALLRDSDHYDDLWAAFRSAMRYLGLATVTSIVGLIITSGTASRVVFIVTVGLTILAALRVARCIWAVNWVIRIFTGQSPETRVEEETV
ncbi:MAG TPA: hypothetical protein VI039_11015 [Solirubrobacterales bacterium]